MNNTKAQEFIDKKVDKSQETVISHGSLQLKESEKLTEELILQDYPLLTEIDLKNHELTALTITNCPQLKKINLRNNQLTKLEITGHNQISEIIAGSNELTSLNLTDCSNLKKLIVPDNTLLSKLAGLNLSTIKEININNTLVNLNEDYENLKSENEGFKKSIEILDDAAHQKKFVLTEPIQTPKQAEAAINQLLDELVKKLKEYFLGLETYGEEEMVKQEPTLSLSFEDPKLLMKGKEVLAAIFEAQGSGNYQKLLKEWNGGDKYNAEYDFDCGSLTNLMNLVDNLEKLKNYEWQQYPNN